MKKRKKIISLVLAVCFIIAQMSCMAYADNTSTKGEVNNAINVPIGSEVMRAETVPIDGGTWNFGVAWNVKGFFQYSYYYHAEKNHYSNAMMENAYSGRVLAVAGKTSSANSPSFADYYYHKSYYGFY